MMKMHINKWIRQCKYARYQLLRFSEAPPTRGGLRLVRFLIFFKKKKKKSDKTTKKKNLETYFGFHPINMVLVVEIDFNTMSDQMSTNRKRVFISQMPFYSRIFFN